MMNLDFLTKRRTYLVIREYTGTRDFMLSGQCCDELLSLCQALVRTPSLSGSEGNLAKLIANAARTLGYDKIHVDAYGNVILHMRFASPGKRLLFH